MSEARRHIAVIGCGVIGAGWAARCLAHGMDVSAWDPAPGAEKLLREAVSNAWPSLQRLGTSEGASPERLRVFDSLEAACEHADFIQEAAPEREDLKRRLHAQIDAACRPDVIIASSTSGLLPTDFQTDCRHPERILVGHPFNPVYLLPLVEVLGGEKTARHSLDRAIAFYRAIGMQPLKVRKEVSGFLSDRLQEALWREVLHLVNDDVADTEELDMAVAYGPGLRWAIWGPCMVFHLAGGEGGIKHMLEHFDPSLFPWTKLEPPEMTGALIEKMEAGCERQAGGRSLRQLEQLRDHCLIDIMRALQTYNEGAGRVLNENS
ncbi:MAG: L-carnitine dehydrogenase [Gammaproteobacteria bacterium]|nr:L-carnitine dehydrogenase [Gammaproteobacteria bacterium]